MLSPEKELLSFEQFQSEVLKVFNASKDECKFWSSSYYFSVLINYSNRQWLFFTVKYSKDPDSCNYGRWSVVKEYDKYCKDVSDSLIEAIKVVAQKTEESIKEEIAVFKHIEK